MADNASNAQYPLATEIVFDYKHMDFESTLDAQAYAY